MIEIVSRAAAKVGGIVELGRRLGISHNAFYRWQEVPPKRVLQIEKHTGISRHEMRPDIYPDEGENHDATDRHPTGGVSGDAGSLRPRR